MDNQGLINNNNPQSSALQQGVTNNQGLGLCCAVPHGTEAGHAFGYPDKNNSEGKGGAGGMQAVRASWNAIWTFGHLRISQTSCKYGKNA